MGALLAALFLAVPGAALADNECGLQVGTTPIECPSDDYSPDGITYVSVGNLVLNLEPISAFGTSLGSGGLDISAGGAGDSLTVTTERIASNRHTAPVVVDLLTQAGDISLDSSTSSVSFPDIQGNAGATEYGVRAISGSGSIDLNLGGVTATGTPGIAAVYAETGGAGSIDIATARTVSGRQYGIQALASGSGALTITATGAVNVINSTDGIAAIDATTGTGLLTVNVASGSGSVNGSNFGTGIRADAGGDVVVNIASGRTVNGGDTALDLTAAGEITVNNAGAIVAQLQDSATIRASGVSLTLNNDGIIRTRMIDFSGLEDGYVFNNNAGARWQFSAGPSPLDGVSELGTGVFNNAGTIELGIREAVLAPGTAFTGTGDSVLEVTAALNVAGQSSCSAPATASCLDLTGGSTSGQTRILVEKSSPSGLDPKSGLTQAANPGVLLVDVSGGTSAAEHFVLHPDSEDYAEDPKYGAVLDTGTGGLLDYALLYNPGAQEHVLTSVPQKEGIEYASFIHQALSIWHTTSDAVAGRQADLRQGAVGGGWARAISEQTERESVSTLTTHGNTFTYDQDYTLDTWSAIGGYDLTSSDNYVVGLHAGFVYSTLEYDNSDTGTRDKTKGATMGAYAGWWNEAGLTLDGTLNTNFLRLQHKVRTGLERSTSDVRSIGLRGEAGWLFPLAGEAFYVQPLATVAYVRSTIELLELRQNKLRFEDEESRRTALGVRVGGDMDLSGNRFGHLKYWLTARAWEENAEDGSVNYLTEGDSLTIEDDISESFEEVGLGVSLTSPDENLEVFLSGNLRSGDQTDGKNVTIGARLNW